MKRQHRIQSLERQALYSLAVGHWDGMRHLDDLLQIVATESRITTTEGLLYSFAIKREQVADPREIGN